MALKMTAALATSMESHEHARIAEQLGYERVWFYDSPPILADAWVQMCRAAERTSRIGLGPGVLVPSLRHPLTTASAIATLVSIAGADRVAIGVGTGFTARCMMGQKPLPWKETAAYVAAVRALLRGERVSWEGHLIQMCHWPGYIADRPIEVPVVLAVSGPKGMAVAADMADGVIAPLAPIPGFAWSTSLIFGTVLREGEDPGSDRVLAAAGHGVAVAYHWALEFDQPDMIPGVEQYAAALAGIPDEERHLLLHEGHLCGLNERDRPFVTGELLAGAGAALPSAGWRERLAGLEAGGATDVAYQPAGDDIPGELEAFAKMMQG
jgi:5,10-methylenetetrahydromethanopterin reductase